MTKLIAKYTNKKQPKRHVLCPDNNIRSLCGRYIPMYQASYNPWSGDLKEWAESDPFDYECKTCIRIFKDGVGEGI